MRVVCLLRQAPAPAKQAPQGAFPFMARPTTARVRRSEEIRQTIQARMIIERLHRHIEGKQEMSQTQIAAANALLDRSVPKLSQIQHVGDENGGPVQMSVTWQSSES
jgi:hypothetical protein